MFRGKVEYDKEADAIYIRLSDKPYAYTKPLDHMRYVDYAVDGTPIGVELLAISDGVDVRDLPNMKEIIQLLEGRRIKIYALSKSTG